MADLAEKIEAVCRELERGRGLQQITEDAGAGPVLAYILQTLREGEVSPTLEDDLNVLDEVLIRYGIDGGLVPDERDYHRTPVSSAGHPIVELWVCPARQCSRRQLLGDPQIEGDSTPVCAITGDRMRRERLADG